MTKNLFILKVKAQAHHFIDIVVAEHIEDGCAALDVLNKTKELLPYWQASFTNSKSALVPQLVESC